MSEVFTKLPANVVEANLDTLRLCGLAEAHWLVKLYWHHLSCTDCQVSSFEEDSRKISIIKKGISDPVAVNYQPVNSTASVAPGLPFTEKVSFGANNLLVLGASDQLMLYTLQYNGPWLRRRFRINEIDKSIETFLNNTEHTVLKINRELFLERELLFQLMREVPQPYEKAMIDWLAAWLN